MLSEVMVTRLVNMTTKSKQFHLTGCYIWYIWKIHSFLRTKELCGWWGGNLLILKIFFCWFGGKLELSDKDAAFCEGSSPTLKQNPGGQGSSSEAGAQKLFRARSGIPPRCRTMGCFISVAPKPSGAHSCPRSGAPLSKRPSPRAGRRRRGGVCWMISCSGGAWTAWWDCYWGGQACWTTLQPPPPSPPPLYCRTCREAVLSIRRWF